MTRGVPELEEAVTAARKPTWSEIVRAKKAITELLADGEPHGIPVEPGHRKKLQLVSDDDIEVVATRMEVASLRRPPNV